MIKIFSFAGNRRLIEQSRQQIGTDGSFGTELPVFVKRQPFIFAHQKIGQMVKRSDIPTGNLRMFRILRTGNQRNITGIAAVAKGHCAVSPPRHHPGNMKIVQRRQRGTFAAVHNVVGTKVIDHRDTGQVCQQPGIADLQRIRLTVAGNRRRKMVTGLPVKTESRYLIALQSADLNQMINGFRHQPGITLHRLNKQRIVHRIFGCRILFYMLAQLDKLLLQTVGISKRKSL